jgi:hypothetical protein
VNQAKLCLDVRLFVAKIKKRHLAEVKTDLGSGDLRYERDDICPSIAARRQSRMKPNLKGRPRQQVTLPTNLSKYQDFATNILPIEVFQCCDTDPFVKQPQKKNTSGFQQEKPKEPQGSMRAQNITIGTTPQAVAALRSLVSHVEPTSSGNIAVSSTRSLSLANMHVSCAGTVVVLWSLPHSTTARIRIC